MAKLNTQWFAVGLSWNQVSISKSGQFEIDSVSWDSIKLRIRLWIKETFLIEENVKDKKFMAHVGISDQDSAENGKVM